MFHFKDGHVVAVHDGQTRRLRDERRTSAEQDIRLAAKEKQKQSTCFHNRGWMTRWKDEKMDETTDREGRPAIEHFPLKTDIISI